MGIANFDAVMPLELGCFHLLGDGVIPISRQAIDTGPQGSVTE